MRDLGSVVIVGFEWVRLDMPVNESVRVISVGLMEVLLRQCRGAKQPRHDAESDDGAPEPERHTPLWTNR